MSDFDSRIAQSLEDDPTFQGLLAELTKAATAETTVRSDEPCGKCSCKHIRMVRVPDFKLKLQIMEFLANRGVGRPAQAEGEQEGERITFVREVRK